MQHAVRLHGRLHEGRGARRGGAVLVPPLMTTVTADVRFSEAAEVQKLVLSSENDPVAGAFTFDIETHRAAVIEDRCSKVLALHMLTGEEPYIRIAAGSKIVVTAFLLPQDIRGLTLTGRHDGGENLQLHDSDDAQGRASLFVHDRRHAEAGAADRGGLFRLDEIPAPTTSTCRRYPCPDRTTHARCTARIRIQERHAPAKGTISNGCKTSYSAT